MHTHTLFCDGRDDIETMCKAAYEKNLFAIGFSAHAPIEKQTGLKSSWHLKEELTEKYITEIKKAKEIWQGKLNVFAGYEMDYIKGKRSALDKDVTDLNLDYIIGSVHYICHKNSENLFTVDGPKEEFEEGLNKEFDNNAEKLMHSYYDAVLEMIEKGGFDILGHADLLKKNCQGKDYWQQEVETSRQREVASAAAKAGIVIEANTGGLNRNKISDLYPSLTFLRIIKEFNIPVIITSDAHKAHDINGNFVNALNILKSAGFNEHVLFKERINRKPVWQKEFI